MNRTGPRLILLAAVAGLAAAALAQTPIARQASRNRWGYDYPPSLDAEVAAPAVHRIRYSDSHIMLMEVANPPGYPMQMHGHPYPSIFARSSGKTHLGGGGPTDQYVETDRGRNGEHWQSAPPPRHTPDLECTAADPQAPHRPVNHGDAPQHFYRIEYKWLEREQPKLARGLRAMDRKLYEDDVIRLYQVTVPRGGHGSRRPLAYPSVLAIDSAEAAATLAKPAGADAGRSLPPDGMVEPRCMTVDAGTVLRFRNQWNRPVHYYRMEFKRIEGAALKDHWREWYPWMAEMK